MNKTQNLYFAIPLVYFFIIGLSNSIQVSPGRDGRVIECEKSKIDHNVTLASGHHAGVFLKANKSIVTMKRCLQQCCQMKGCDVAFFSNGVCYSVKCDTLDSCAPTSSIDKRMMVSISYVAKPKISTKSMSRDKFAELEVTDNLIAEVTAESPFLEDDNAEENSASFRSRSSPWKETKDAVMAVVCGCVAVAVGVAGIIVMTRQLVEDDEPYPLSNTHNEKVSSNFKSKEDILPTIRESDETEITHNDDESCGEKIIEMTESNTLQQLPSIDEIE